MMLDDFIKEFSKDKEKKKKVSVLGNIPHGSEALIISKISEYIKKDILFICENKKKYNQIKDVLNFLEIKNVYFFPEYDTNTYDRISPNKNITSERVKTLIELKYSKGNKIILTTSKASSQFIAEKQSSYYKNLNLETGSEYDLIEIKSFLVEHGYTNTSYVREVGEFAIRGGIIDFYPFNYSSPVRLDFFGNKLDLIKTFDANTQLSHDQNLDDINIYPCDEIILNNELVNNFRSNFNLEFGSESKNSKLYESVSNKITYPGIESWLPFFYNSKSTIIDYCNDPVVILDNSIFEIINDFEETLIAQYKTRIEFDSEKENTEKYYSLSPDQLFLGKEEYRNIVSNHKQLQFSSLKNPKGNNLDANNIQGFYSSDKLNKVDYQSLKHTITKNINDNNNVFLACSSEGSRLRLSKIFKNQNIDSYLFDKFSDLQNINERE